MYTTDRITPLAASVPTGDACRCGALVYTVLCAVETADGRPVELVTIHRCTRGHLEE
jgi:hypothetical protein